MAYPKQLISSLSEQINEKLLNFFEIENRKYFQNYADLNDIVENTLWQYIKNETEKSFLFFRNLTLNDSVADSYQKYKNSALVLLHQGRMYISLN